MTFVKICGITRLSDARAAARAGANAIGFVFSPSPRRVSLARAAAISAHIHPSVMKVGVFVDAPLERVEEVVTGAGLDGVQLQGGENGEFIAEVRLRFPSLFVSKVIRVRTRTDVAQASEFSVDAILFDRKDPSRPTVRARPIPAAWLEGVQGRFVLAGGLTPGNVGRLVRALAPWGVDVSGGVEERPGRKDPDVIRSFLRAVRRASL